MIARTTITVSAQSRSKELGQPSGQCLGLYQEIALLHIGCHLPTVAAYTGKVMYVSNLMITESFSGRK